MEENIIRKPCLLRKNTEEIRKQLEELGYKNGTPLDVYNYDGHRNHKLIDEGTAIITCVNNYYRVIYEVDSLAKKDRTDCGTNEDLFFAIAAISNVTDKWQWFVLDDDFIWEQVGCFRYKGYFEFCRHDVRGGCDAPPAHKATPGELVDFFAVRIPEKREPVVRVSVGMNDHEFDMIDEFFPPEYIEIAKHIEVSFLNDMGQTITTTLYDIIWHTDRVNADMGNPLNMTAALRLAVWIIAGNYEELKAYESGDYWGTLYSLLRKITNILAYCLEHLDCCIIIQQER